MKAAVVGHRGMLGSDLAAELAARGHATIGVDLPEFDLTKPEDCARLVAGRNRQKFDWVFNCAAYTAVDKAESERDAAFAVNGLGPGYLAHGCALAGARLIHLSTDFVFDGHKGSPYMEDDPVNPLGVYGESKLQGERAALAMGAAVVRTAWLFGPNGASFPRAILRAWLAGKPLRVVADQTGNPTYTADLARVLVDLAERNAEPGVWHAAGPEAMTWHDLAERVVEAYRKEVAHDRPQPEIEAIGTADWPTSARRPANSVLDCGKLAAFGIPPMRPMEEALREFAARLPHP